MRPHHPCRCTDGFTLLELLTAIAIISVLGTIVFSFSVQAFESSRQSKCLSGLRQLQMANLLYAIENNGNFVPVFVNNATGSSRNRWHNNRTFTTLLGCPTTVPASIPANIRCPNSKVQGSTAWGYNFTGLSGGINDGGHTRGFKQNDILRPNETIAFIDALDWQVQRGGADRYVEDGAPVTHATAYRHGNNNFANAVFWDGHTQSLSREELVGNRRLWDVLAP